MNVLCFSPALFLIHYIAKRKFLSIVQCTNDFRGANLQFLLDFCHLHVFRFHDNDHAGAYMYNKILMSSKSEEFVNFNMFVGMQHYSNLSDTVNYSTQTSRIFSQLPHLHKKGYKNRTAGETKSGI